MLETMLGVLFSFYWLIYVGQIISVADLALARRLGLQEDADTTDVQYQRDTAYTARWDALCMWVLPLGGTLMLLDLQIWPYLALTGGALYLDTGARQYLKLSGLKAEGVRVGTRLNVRLALSVYVSFVAVGLVGLGVGFWGLAACLENF